MEYSSNEIVTIMAEYSCARAQCASLARLPPASVIKGYVYSICLFIRRPTDRYRCKYMKKRVKSSKQVKNEKN